MRTFVSAFVDKRLNTLDSDWKKLKAFERVQMLEKFMRFSLPTLQSINITEDFGKKWETMDDNQKKEFANIVIDLWSTQQSKNTNS